MLISPLFHVGYALSDSTNLPSAESVNAQSKIANPIDPNSVLAPVYEAADKICGTVQLHGEDKSAEVQGKINGELSKLISKIANIGAEASAKLSNQVYEGLAQKDLPQVIATTEQCREIVFNTVMDKLIPSLPSLPSSPCRQPNAVIMNGSGGSIGELNAFGVTANGPLLKNDGRIDSMRTGDINIQQEPCSDGTISAHIDLLEIHRSTDPH